MSHYDKEDNFNFPIVRMPCLCSNIFSTIFYYAFGAEIFKTKSKCNEFRTSPRALLNKAQNQGDNTVTLKRTIFKYFDRHSEVFQMFNDTSITIKNSLFGRFIA